MIATLIDKQDTFEIVRDQIAAILVVESANQVALATTAGKPNPEDWKLRVFTERSNPQEQFLDESDPDPSPLVNVWFDTSTYPRDKGNVFERQTSETIYNIDCIGFGVSKDVPAGGHVAGDQEAALEAQRAYRLVRNILMAAEYRYLSLQKTVGERWPQSATAFFPEINGQTVAQISGFRLALRVSFNEFSPQFVPEILELVSVSVKRSEDGEILLLADYPSTPP